MQGTKLLIPIVVPGTLTANFDATFTIPFDCSLRHISCIVDASTSIILDVGTAGSTQAYLASGAVTGHATAPTEFDTDDFVGAVDPHLAAGTVLAVTVDYDGGAGTDGAGLSILLTLTEG